MTEFSVMTFNCNGLGEKCKRQKVFTYIKDKLQKGFCFLQETHSTEALEKIWKTQWGGELFFSHGQSNSTGCAIGVSKDFPFRIIKQSKDSDGRFLILEVEIDDDKFLLINLYNANTETDQLRVLDQLLSKLDEHDEDGLCRPIFGGDLNLIFDSVLDSSGGNPTLKKRSLAKLMKILDKLDAHDIFRIRYPTLKRFTFFRKRPAIQRRLDYIFTANSIQEFVDSVKILPSFMSDHSPVFIKINMNSKVERGKYGWKFNNSLLLDKDFPEKMKQHLKSLNNDLKKFENPHLKWEFMKYEARKFSIAFSKQNHSEDTRLKLHHEKIISQYVSSENRPTDAEYAESKLFLEDFIDKKNKGAILRSKCILHEQNEKSSKYFFNLEKKMGENSIIKKLVKNDIEISNNKDILKELHEFYSSLFERKISKSKNDCNEFLNTLQLPVISQQHKNDCDKALTMKDLEDALFKMSVGKSPGNDGLTVEFFKCFWDDIKTVFFSSVCYSRTVGELSSSQRQAIIKLIEKKDKDKRYIENWRPISLLNIDTKIISKSLASRFIPVLATIISSDQTAYVKGRYIGESIRLLSDVLDASERYNIPGFILTVDLQKAFDSIDHYFLIACLEKFGFGTNFLAWISILLNKNESCVSNGGHTTQYFSLNRGARQGDPIAAYLFIIVLEIFFIMIRSNTNIHPLRIIDFVFLLTAYADDTTFFVADLSSVNEIFSTFNEFSIYSGMSINASKCELAGIGVKKSVVPVLCGVKVVSLCNDSIRVLGVHFTYCQKLFMDRNYVDSIKKLQNVLHVWAMRLLSLYGKILIFKSLALSKLISVASMSIVPSEIIKLVENIHRNFIWDKKRPNIKHSTLIGDYARGGLKDVDISSKFKSLHLNWLRRLFDGNFHPWKQLPIYYFKTVAKASNLFHPNLSIASDQIRHIPTFYQNMVKYWQEICQSQPTTSSLVLSESLCFNSHIKIDGRPISSSFLNTNKYVTLSDLFDNNGHLITWEVASDRLNVTNYFNWLQIANSIPSSWKKIVKDSQQTENNCLVQHLNIKGKAVAISRLDSKSFYNLFIDKIYSKPSSQKYFERLYGPLNWNAIYLLPRLTTSNSATRMFQYKILYNTLFLKSRLYHLGYSNDSNCSLCGNFDETPTHFFSNCVVTTSLWDSLRNLLRPYLVLEPLSPQSAILGIFLVNDKHHLLRNHLLFLFKYCVYKYRTENISIHTIVGKIKSTLSIEKQILCEENFNKKWSIVTPILQ